MFPGNPVQVETVGMALFRQQRIIVTGRHDPLVLRRPGGPFRQQALNVGNVADFPYRRRGDVLKGHERDNGADMPVAVNKAWQQGVSVQAPDYCVGPRGCLHFGTAANCQYPAVPHCQGFGNRLCVIHGQYVAAQENSCLCRLLICGVNRVNRQGFDRGPRIIHGQYVAAQENSCLCRLLTCGFNRVTGYW